MQAAAVQNHPGGPDLKTVLLRPERAVEIQQNIAPLCTYTYLKTIFIVFVKLPCYNHYITERRTAI